MKLNYGPHTDGAEVIATEDDKEILIASMTAVFEMGQTIGAHDPESETVETLFNAQSTMRTLLKYRNLDDDEGLWMPLDEVFATAMATAFLSTADRDIENIDDAAGVWAGEVTDIRGRTSQEAIYATTSPVKEAPDDPWDERMYGNTE